MEEKSFFNKDNVSVSNSRFIVDGQTYAMNGVTSVKTARKDPSKTGPLFLVLLGIFFLAINGVIGFITIGTAIYLFAKQKPELTVILNSSSGEAQALTSKDASYISEVVEALNNSIVYRG